MEMIEMFISKFHRIFVRFLSTRTEDSAVFTIKHSASMAYSATKKCLVNALKIGFGTLNWDSRRVWVSPIPTRARFRLPIKRRPTVLLIFSLTTNT